MISPPDLQTIDRNVDGFHRAAGSCQIIAIHGDLHEICCTECPWRETVSDYMHLPDLPRCGNCAGVLRPAVVLFGEVLPSAGVRELNYQVREGFDLVFSVGTTSILPYISYPIEVARQRDKPTVEINLGTTRISGRWPRCPSRSTCVICGSTRRPVPVASTQTRFVGEWVE